MTSQLQAFVPKLEGVSNFNSWKIKITAYLKSLHLFGVVDGTTTRHATDADQQRAWDEWDTRATGTITLSLNEGVQRKIERLINAAVPNAADRQSNHWWTNLQTQYGTVTPSQIFRIYRKVLDFRMDTSKHP